MLRAAADGGRQAAELLVDRKDWKQCMVMSKILDLFRPLVEPARTMEDALFGKLTWDEKYRGWRGTLTMANGKTAVVTIDGVKTDESIPEEARNTAKFLIANAPLIDDKIAASTSELYNGTWGDGDTMTPEEMARRIRLTEVSFYDEGGAELYYHAYDDLFTDHSICASLDANGELSEPDLAG